MKTRNIIIVCTVCVIFSCLLIFGISIMSEEPVEETPTAPVSAREKALIGYYMKDGGKNLNKAVEAQLWQQELRKPVKERMGGKVYKKEVLTTTDTTQLTSQDLKFLRDLRRDFNYLEKLSKIIANGRIYRITDGNTKENWGSPTTSYLYSDDHNQLIKIEYYTISLD